MFQSIELNRAPKKFTPDAIEALQKHNWPGNIRELQNRIKRALVLTEESTLSPNDLELELGPRWQAGASLREAREELEKELISRKLRETRGNISKTAKALGISRPTLY